MKIFLFALLFAVPSFAADQKPSADMMAKFVAASSPGAEHRRLADLVGDYTFKSKAWHSADGKAMEGSGTASFKMILGGRWLQQTVLSPAANGMPAYDGHGMMGYDNVSKNYVSAWMDTMSTGAMIGKGEFDSSTKTLKDAGTYSCPMTGKDRAYRSEWKMIDKTSMVFSLFGTSPMDPSNKEFKMMELTYKRK